MKAKNRLLIPFLILTFSLASVASSQAVVLIYKVTFSAKARYFSANNPRGNSFRHRGYLIYDTANPGASVTVELLRGKTYQIQGSMINNIAPSSIGFFPLDRNADAFFETQGGNIGTSNGTITVSRSYLGSIPRAGIRFGNSVPIPGIARTLRGSGAVTAVGTDQFKTTDVWRIDRLTASNPVNAQAGLNLVTAYLAGRRYVQVP